jgi:hypothetical protein
MEFNLPLDQSVAMGVLTSRQAWELDLLQQMEWQPTKADWLLITVVNLVNCPVEYMQRH